MHAWGATGSRVAIKVLFFIGSFEQGGAERQAAELVRGLDTSRYEPHLAVCNTTDQLGYSLPFASRTDLHCPSGPEARTMLRLVRLMRKLRPDIIHSYMGHQNIYGRIAARIAGGAKVIGSVRNTRLPRSYIRQERLTHSFTDALIVNSSQIKDELVRRAHIPGEGIAVVENGVDTGRFRPLSAGEREEARARFAIRGTTLVVPGRISFQKNQVAIVRAVGRLRRRGAWPDDARVVLAGRQEASTRYGTLLRAAIALTGTVDVVRFAGVVREIEQLVGAADAVLLPSRYEGLPNAVLESLAAGTPAIVSPGANADGLVTGGGIALSGDDPGAIEEGLSRFFSLTAPQRAAMGARGREQALGRFSLDRMIRETCAVYERVLSKTA